MIRHVYARLLFRRQREADADGARASSALF